MKQILSILATLCAILFILTGTTVLLLFNIEQRAFESATYKQAFEEQHLYDRMPAILATAVHGMIAQNPGAYPFLKELSPEDWQVTIASLLPPDELRTVTDAALDSTFDYVNRKADFAVITLAPIKARLDGQTGVDIVTQFLSTQPACTIEQLQQMALGLLGGDIALCNPPPEAMGLIAPFIESQIGSIAAAIPDQIILIAGTDGDSPDDPRLRLHMVRSAVRFSPYFVILLLLAVAVFAIRGIRDLLVWWGWPLATTGFFSFIIALVGAPAMGLFLQFIVQTQGLIPLPPLLAPTITETISGVAGELIAPVIWQGLTLMVIGGIMFVLGFLLPRPVVVEVR